MPALSVTLNGESIACVATDGLDVIDVGVSGALLGPEHATLQINGGSYADGQESQFRIWEDQLALVPGDAITVTFSVDGANSRPGKTIEELYPDEKPTQQEPFAPVEQVVRELKQKPKAFESLAFEFIGADGDSVRAQTAPEEHGFSFTVLWNSHRPQRARVSVCTYTLDSLIKKEGGKYHAEAKLEFGQRVTFKVLAPNSTVERDARKSGTRPSM